MQMEISFFIHIDFPFRFYLSNKKKHTKCKLHKFTAHGKRIFQLDLEYAERTVFRLSLGKISRKRADINFKSCSHFLNY